MRTLRCLTVGAALLAVLPASAPAQRQGDVDDDRRDEEHGQQQERRPEEEAEVDPLSSQLGAGEVGHGYRPLASE